MPLQCTRILSDKTTELFFELQLKISRRIFLYIFFFFCIFHFNLRFIKLGFYSRYGHIVKHNSSTICIKVIKFNICNDENKIRDASILKYALNFENRKRPPTSSFFSTPIFFIVKWLTNQKTNNDVRTISVT